MEHALNNPRFCQSRNSKPRATCTFSGLVHLSRYLNTLKTVLGISKEAPVSGFPWQNGCPSSHTESKPQSLWLWRGSVWTNSLAWCTATPHLWGQGTPGSLPSYLFGPSRCLDFATPFSSWKRVPGQVFLWQAIPAAREAGLFSLPLCETWELVLCSLCSENQPGVERRSLSCELVPSGTLKSWLPSTWGGGGEEWQPGRGGVWGGIRE